DEYIESINPLMGSVGLTFEQDTWSSELIVNWANRMSKVNDGKMKTSGYGSVDWLVNWQINDALKLNLVANNLFDKEYAMYSNVAGFDATDDVNSFTEAGRNFSVNVKYRF
ncbi:MAG: TonB-dependent receptor, partial [Litorilituus sp.]|nr:TonB-dependent receptor [Litorilituus sp.]